MTHRFTCSTSPPYQKIPSPEIYTVIPVKMAATRTVGGLSWGTMVETIDLVMCEMPAAYVLDVVTARKDHLCIECKGWIKRGEKYNNHHGVWDGSGFTYKVCMECEALRADVDKDVPYVEERTAFGNLCESVFEGGELEFMRRFLTIKERRGGPIQKWMNEHFDKLQNKEDDKIEDDLDYERDGQDSN